MTVRAKFRADSFEVFSQTTYPHTEGGTVKPDYNRPEKIEVRSIKMSVVVSGSEENKKFFASTPTGQITLSTLNKAAWEQFELNKEYYVDFTPAE